MPQTMTRLLALAALAAASITTAQAAVPADQKTWLMDLYSSTDGSHWIHIDNWSAISDPCDDAWYGVTCNAGKTSVTILNLSANNLQGPLPTNWATVFPDLEQINLVSNDLTGPVPALSGFNKLMALYLSANPGLTGSLPDPSGLPELVSYYSVGTGFSGPIPPLTGLPKLKAFFVGNNQLTGTIPALTGLPVLEQFNVAGNQLSGPVPAAPGTLTAANSLLCGNHLDAVANAAWDTATGQVPWYTDCTYVITPSAGANGSIAPGFGVTPVVALNAQPSYIATPDAGYLLDAFGGTCTGTAAGNTFTIDPAVRNCTVIASFRSAAPPLPPAGTANAIPTLGEWALALLGLLIVASQIGLQRLSRKRKQL